MRNLADGSVELLAQGSPAEVTAFLDDIAETMSAHIERVDATEDSVQTDLSGFTVRQ